MKRWKVEKGILTTAVFLAGSWAYAQEPTYYYRNQETGTMVLTNVPPTEREAPELVARLTALAKPEQAVAVAKKKAGQSAVSFDPNQFNVFIEKYADRHQIDPNLIRAVIRAESNFNPYAVSRKGAKGLMQLMPDTAKRYGVASVYDPEENIQGGVRYLRFLLDLFRDNLRHSVAAYNAGENAVLRVGGIPPYRETVEFVKRVVRFYGSEQHQARSEPSNPFGVYVYRDPEGTLVMTNIDPPSRSAY